MCDVSLDTNCNLWQASIGGEQDVIAFDWVKQIIPHYVEFEFIP